MESSLVPAPVSLVDPGDAWVQKVAGHIFASVGDCSDLLKAEAALSFVQRTIRYTSDEKLYGCTEFWAAPVETLYLHRGDCEDTSVLFCSIVSTMGLDCVLLDYNGHVAAGVSVGDGYLFWRPPATSRTASAGGIYAPEGRNPRSTVSVPSLTSISSSTTASHPTGTSSRRLREHETPQEDTMNAIKSRRVGAVAVLVVACTPMLFSEDSDAATGDGTIYLRPGDTYTWTPTFNIDSSRVSLTVNASTTTTAGEFSSSSAAGNVTASVENKTVSIAVGSNATASTVYVKVKATTTSGVSQTATATITVKIIVPTISYSNVNTYQDGTVNATPTINGASVDGKTVTYTATGLPAGFSVNASNGKVTGTVGASAQAKTYSVKVTGTIATDPTQTFSTTFSIVVASSMSLTAPGTQYTAQGTAKDITLSGSNTISTTTWAITSQAVTGISMSTATGASGKITVASTVAAGTTLSTTRPPTPLADSRSPSP